MGNTVDRKTVVFCSTVLWPVLKGAFKRSCPCVGNFITSGISSWKPFWSNFFIIFTKKEIFHLFLLKKKYFCCVGVYFFYLFLKFFSSSTKIIKKPQFKSTSKTKYLIMEKLPICGHSKRNIKRNRNMDSERERNTDRQKTIQWNN